jgi:hypothetical protein
MFLLCHSFRRLLSSPGSNFTAIEFIASAKVGRDPQGQDLGHTMAEREFHVGHDIERDR